MCEFSIKYGDESAASGKCGRRLLLQKRAAKHDSLAVWLEPRYVKSSYSFGVRANVQTFKLVRKF